MAVKVQCPYCQDVKQIRDVRPGTFKVPCTHCRATLRLIITQDGEDWIGEVHPIAPPPGPEPAAEAQPAAHVQGASRALTVDAGPAAAEGPSAEADGGPDSGDDDWPRGRRALGGYLRIARIGGGGLGSVYRARQLAPGRDAAVKVVSRRWAHDGKALERFAREGYAAAQLLHPNVASIYDVGADRSTYFFGMEFVDGGSLEALLRGRRRLAPAEAVGYVLQAARGLKAAHDQGMIHRDVRPANLMLGGDGVVKVADLGLVKAPEGEDLERAKSEPAVSALPNSTMGPPTYMAPELARDASRADARADIYALGCTLFALVTGRPPFEGKTVQEILDKHASEPPVPPDRVAKDVPAELSAIIQRMMAKEPEGRYPDCASLIQALEEFQARQAPDGQFRPGAAEVERLEDAAARFADAPAARLRAPVVLGALALGLFMAALTLGTGRLLASLGFLALIALTVLALEVVAGMTAGSPVFERARALLLGGSARDWATIAAGVLGGLALIWFLGLTGLVIGFSIVAAGLAAGYHYGIGRPLALQRDEPLADLEDLIRTLRLRGIAEEEIRAFVRDHAGPRWEELFESLFGYDAKIIARARGRAIDGRRRPRFAAWRDPIVAWADRVRQGRQAERDRKALNAIEMKALLLQGEDDLYKVRKAADRASRAMVIVAEKARLVAIEKARGEQSRPFAMIRELEKISYDKAKGIMRIPEEAHVEEDESFARMRYLLDLLLGPSIRFIAGSFLAGGGGGLAAPERPDPRARADQRGRDRGPPDHGGRTGRRGPGARRARGGGGSGRFRVEARAGQGGPGRPPPSPVPPRVAGRLARRAQRRVRGAVAGRLVVRDGLEDELIRGPRRAPGPARPAPRGPGPPRQRAPAGVDGPRGDRVRGGPDLRAHPRLIASAAARGPELRLRLLGLGVLDRPGVFRCRALAVAEGVDPPFGTFPVGGPGRGDDPLQGLLLGLGQIPLVRQGLHRFRVLLQPLRIARGDRRVERFDQAPIRWGELRLARAPREHPDPDRSQPGPPRNPTTRHVGPPSFDCPQELFLVVQKLHLGNHNRGSRPWEVPGRCAGVPIVADGTGARRRARMAGMWRAHRADGTCRKNWR
jgi:hypothetical protein